MLLGRATPEATARYAARHGSLKRTQFFRECLGRTVSSLGIGTYLGEKNPEADAAYKDAITAALRGGINFIDTSLNYRNQRSERAIAQAILQLSGSPKELDRDEFFVCTKAGYLIRNAVPEGLEPGDIVGEMHSMAPAFLADQLKRSRQNLGLETIDVFYLHNPETQFGFVGQDEFYTRLRTAFAFLEEAVSAGEMQFYGAATWEGFRKPHGLSLVRMESVAREVGGPDHHFRFIQLPFNLAMPEAMVSRHEDSVTILEAAQRLGICVVSSASILQSRLAKDLPETLSGNLPGLTTDAQRAIQFARSAPGILSALVGMGRVIHLEENLGVAAVPPLTESEFSRLFRVNV